MMKKLLYVAAIAVLSTSCSVDSLQDENSTDFNEITGKATSTGELTACYTANIINDLGEVRGQIESFINEDKETLILTFTTYDWKIKDSELFLGDKKDIELGTGLFGDGKYGFNESFDGSVYVTQYEFKLLHINSDFVLMAYLYLTDDNALEQVWADGTVLEGKDKYVIEDFTKYCL